MPISFRPHRFVSIALMWMSVSVCVRPGLSFVCANAIFIASLVFWPIVVPSIQQFHCKQRKFITTRCISLSIGRKWCIDISKISNAPNPTNHLAFSSRFKPFLWFSSLITLQLDFQQHLNNDKTVKTTAKTAMRWNAVWTLEICFFHLNCRNAYRRERNIVNILQFCLTAATSFGHDDNWIVVAF